MSEQNKANTWWIMWKSGYRNQATVTVEKPFTYNSSLVHVIEKSAFDSVFKDLAEQIKVNLAGQERELKIMHEVEKLRAENERLKDSINSDFFAEVIMEWKSFWMNQTQNGEEDRQNYFNRAFGVDANMRYDLANRIVKALRGADENS